MMRVLRLAVIVAVLAGGLPVLASARPAAAQPEVPRFEESDCLFDVPTGERIDCGYLVVQEDRERSGSPLIRLAVAILHSTGRSAAPDPVIYLEGGPGGGAVAFADQWFDSPLRRGRDLILFDQRGTGLSEPLLDCPELDELSLDLLEEALAPAQEVQAYTAAARACRDRLRTSGVNLAAYTSHASAADVVDLREVLGYDEWNLYGISYGTRLALTIMRDYPVGVRSAILDSVYPPVVSGLVELVPNIMRAFDTLFAGCASDPACQASYPDLQTTFFDLVHQLNADPVVVPVMHPTTAERYDFLLTGDALVEGVFQALYVTDLIPYLPFLIGQIRDGEPQLFADIAMILATQSEFISEGMYYAVECYEEVPFNALDDLLAAAEPYPDLLPLAQALPEYAVCPLWDVAPAPPVESEAVTSDIPTLIFSGEYDPITPPAWGQTAAATLPHSFVYDFPGVGHGVSVVAECPQQIMLDFLADPATAPDAACVAEMGEPAFITP